ncbi:MAG: hypothetical protein ABIT08_07005 [Bacteroidia bacterium]
MMKDKKFKNTVKKILPVQRIGNVSGAVAEENAQHSNSAREKYEAAKKRLSDVNTWEQYAGSNATSFNLYNQNGTKIKRSAQEGDFIAIDLPGPGPRRATDMTG